MADEPATPNGGTSYRLQSLVDDVAEHGIQLDKLTRGMADLLGDLDIPGSTGRIERMRDRIDHVDDGVQRLGHDLRTMRTDLGSEVKVAIATALADAHGGRLIRNWSGIKKFAFAIAGSVIAGVLIAVIAVLLQVAAKLPSPVKP